MQVSKMLSPEEKTILANIKSLVSQLEAMEGADPSIGEEPDRPAEIVESKKPKNRKEKGMDFQGVKTKLMAGESLEPEERLQIIEALPAGDMVEAAIPDEDMTDEEDDEMMMSKATASDDAEERVGDNTEETTDDAVGEVGENMKQIVAAITSEVNKSLKGLQDQIGDNAKAIAGLLEGLGITKSFEDEEPKKRPVKKTAPVVVDAKQLLEIINGQPVQKSEDADSIGMVESFEVRKSSAQAGAKNQLGGVLTSLLGVNSQANGRF
jgi:hypothetical protein